MRVADLMARDVEFVPADAPVRDAAELMGELDVGALPVGSAARLDGVVTDRDLLYRVVAQGLDCGQVTVRQVMSRPVVTCLEDDTVQAALDLMAANHVRRLPVLDAAGRVTGWLTLADISRRTLLDSGTLQSALQAVTEAA